MAARGHAKVAADTHSARTPGSLLPPPPYCSRPGRARGLKPRDNLPERSLGGACMGASAGRAPDCDGEREGECFLWILAFGPRD